MFGNPSGSGLGILHAPGLGETLHQERTDSPSSGYDPARGSCKQHREISATGRIQDVNPPISTLRINSLSIPRQTNMDEAPQRSATDSHGVKYIY